MTTTTEPSPWMVQAFLQHDAMLSTLYFSAHDLPGVMWQLEARSIDLHNIVSITKAMPRPRPTDG
jgi:hypothetical protein